MINHQGGCGDIFNDEVRDEQGQEEVLEERVEDINVDSEGGVEEEFESVPKVAWNDFEVNVPQGFRIESQRRGYKIC